jgi:hypothetical protein
MNITKISEMLTAIEQYFGGFNNEIVKTMFAEELAYIKQSDFNAIFRHIITHNPSSWHPDIKALNDAVIALKIDTLNEPARERKCPVCGTVNYSSGCCPVCKYAGSDDGTPDEYRAFWTDWKAGKVPKFDFSTIRTNRVDI